MAEQPQTILIEKDLRPVYYDDFRCIMGACQCSCCSNWQIEFSKKDYLTLKRTPKSPEMEELTRKCVRRLREREHDGMYAKLHGTETARCAFHTPEGLCRLQLECGEDVLPSVCKTYPRSIIYTPAAKEYALAPSCEGVLQQLWELPEGIEFIEAPLPKAEQGNIHIPPGENLIFYFEPIRALCVDILQNRSMPLSNRMLCLGMILQRLQNADWTAFDPDTWVKQMSALASTEEIVKITADIPGNRDMYLLQNMKVLAAISAKVEGWTAELYDKMAVKRQITVTVQEDGGPHKVGKYSVQYSQAAYEDALAQFQAAFPDREYFFENLMVAVVLLQGFPALTSKEELWKSYVSLCNLYSFFRFVSVVGCKGNATKERLFHMIVMASRATLHNQNRFHGFQKDLFQNDSSTLAHMAILLGG